MRTLFQGTSHACITPAVVVSLEYVEELVLTHVSLKVPCKNIKTVTLSGYMSTIFGRSSAAPPKVAYLGNI